MKLKNEDHCEARTAFLADRAEFLSSEAGSRLVRRIANEDGGNSRRANALFDLAAGLRLGWTMDDWNQLLTQLDSCDLTCDEWLKRRGYQ